MTHASCHLIVIAHMTLQDMWAIKLVLSNENYIQRKERNW